MERKSYQLTSSITMVDNRGWSMMNAFEMGEIYAQLGNLIPVDEKVEWTTEYQDMLFRVEDADIEPSFTDVIVPIFVYSVKKDIADAEAAEIKLFIKKCRDLTARSCHNCVTSIWVVTGLHFSLSCLDVTNNQSI
ncbi:Hypothetical predicted protein [Pelobates cultripes]|uniref:Uncharacterized protein n=1 Tax=Pelobates cultripes TaxID=61616 RepID=A0AAD1SWN5_PELCU|nr:Hypothetical predicted protein [Pelobates cultripes]